MDRSNRRIGLRVISAYRTVSKPAVEVLSGMPPLELIAEYRSSMKTIKEREEAEEKMIQAWQLRWDQADKGRWTHRLIPNVKRWHKRKIGMLHYHLTQALTGHGCFSAYLHRFGKLPTPTCIFCGHHTDGAEHTLFECDAWYDKRRNMRLLIGEDVTAETMITIMLGSRKRRKEYHREFHPTSDEGKGRRRKTATEKRLKN